VSAESFHNHQSATALVIAVCVGRFKVGRRPVPRFDDKPIVIATSRRATGGRLRITFRKRHRERFARGNLISYPETPPHSQRRVPGFDLR